MSVARPATPLTRVFLQQIRERGRLSVAEFMRLCLYHPQHGYYTRAAGAGTADYYTSPHVHPIFGQLLARQVREMWEVLGRPARFDLVEFGAGDGTLAGHLVGWLEANSPELAERLAVQLVEVSTELRQRGAERLAGSRCVRVDWQETPPPGPYLGCVYSNEFLDALPVHLVVQRRGELHELYVSAREEELVWEEGELSSPAIGDYLARYGAPLALGQRAEVGLQALAWLEQVGQALERGFVLTIDYGHLARELYSALRPAGTLLAYRRHRASEDVLAWPGEQDLTAHVNFTALIEHGRSLRLVPLGLCSQAKFLLALGKESEFADLYVPEASECTRYQARLRLKQLIYPEGMGETFKVLVQSKGVGPVALAGLQEV